MVARAHHGSVSREERKAHRGGAQGRRSARGRRHQQPRARHRHGRGGPGGPGRGAAERGRRPAARRPGRSPGRQRLARRGLPEAPRRPGVVCRGGPQDDHRRHRGAALSAQPARRAGPADRGDGRDGAVASRRAGRAGPARGAVRRAAGVGARRGAGHALRSLPVDRVRRAAPAPGLGPRRRRADRAPGRAAPGGHQWRHDPRPRPVRRVPGRCRTPGPGRRARRGDGLRVPGRRRVPARLDFVADRGHHARSGAGLARARRLGSDAVLEGRRAGPPGRAGPRDRRADPRAGPRTERHGPERCWPRTVSTRGRSTISWPT